jgi:hypothetical protein
VLEENSYRNENYICPIGAHRPAMQAAKLCVMRSTVWASATQEWLCHRKGIDVDTTETRTGYQVLAHSKTLGCSPGQLPPSMPSPYPIVPHLVTANFSHFLRPFSSGRCQKDIYKFWSVVNSFFLYHPCEK